MPFTKLQNSYNAGTKSNIVKFALVFVKKGQKSFK